MNLGAETTTMGRRRRGTRKILMMKNPKRTTSKTWIVHMSNLQRDTHDITKYASHMKTNHYKNKTNDNSMLQIAN
jgi:hypothetical protein